MSPQELHFNYRDANGIPSTRALHNWHEDGNYLIGVDADLRATRTFRKDRVVEYLEGSETLLSAPYPPPPEIDEDAEPERLQILFTGFARVQRGALEAKAAQRGMHVCKTVTKGLMFLCAGPNAGPTKVAAARGQHVYILAEWQFHELVRTGVLPADDAADTII